MPPRSRQTNEERSARTRAKVLDATIECLLELGYAGTTTTLISERAGVSRGAQLHHFPTKGELVAAAVEHLAQRLGDALQEEAASLPSDGDRVTAAIDLLWSRFSTPLFAAWLELWVAARTDPELAATVRPVEERLTAGLQKQGRAMFAPADASADYEVIALLTFYLMQGLALDRVLGQEGARRRGLREEAAIGAWKQAVEILLATTPVSA
ncbi:MAG: TetR family transcriptional regulator [Acidimicrobiia bacterium]|nr:TetR family transcriptional regulator [Acidimicrobiia bacterium]MBV9284410.1 TetR family transcriptional regulator [Acidimicrobiia bacterium]